MGNQISDADDTDLSSAINANGDTLLTLDHISAGHDDRQAVCHDIAINRFRQVMKATGGRFAEMTAEEEGEIFDHLAIFTRRLRQPSEGMTQ